MKKFFLILLVLTMLLPVFSTASAQDKEEVTISLWTHDGLYVDFFSARAEEWKENYPDIEFTFNFEVIPEVFDVALANLAAGEEMPDLIGLEQGSFPRFMEGGILEDKFVDLTDLVGNDYERVTEGRWTPYTYNGRIYGLESGLSAVGYYYQPAIFEEYGLEIPTTWNELLEAGEVLAEGGIAIIPMPEGADFFRMLFYQRGGNIFSPTGEFVFGSEENQAHAVAVLNLIKEGYDLGVFDYYVGGDYWGAAHMTGYQEGRIASAIMPDWFSDYMLKPMTEGLEGKFRITTMPLWDDGAGHNTSAWGGTGFAISKDTENGELVWDFLKYSYLTPEGQIKRFEEIRYFPSMMEAFDDPRVVNVEDEFFGGQKIGQTFAEMVDDQPIWYQSQFLAAFNDAIGADITLMLEGDMSAEEAVEDVIYIVEDEIAFYE